MTNLHLSTPGGKLQKGRFSILFSCDISPQRETPPSCLIWQRNVTNKFAITFLHAPSGSGKTSLLNCLHQYLCTGSSDLEFVAKPKLSFHPPSCVGVIPQNPPFVNHWGLNSLLSFSSANEQEFYKDFIYIGDDRVDAVDPKRKLGQLSGGQQRKIYTLSVLQHLISAPSDMAFLLMDETFDGLGDEEAVRALNLLLEYWNKRTNKYLHILQVTHLDIASVTRQFAQALNGSQVGISINFLSLNTITDRENELVVKLESYNAAEI